MYVCNTADIDDMLRDCEVVTPVDVPNDLEIDIMDEDEDDEVYSAVKISRKGTALCYLILILMITCD